MAGVRRKIAFTERFEIALHILAEFFTNLVFGLCTGKATQHFVKARIIGFDGGIFFQLRIADA